MIPDHLRQELEQRVAHAVTPREAAVDVMKELQRHYGWLTDEAVQEAAGLLGLSPLQVEELATFYEMIYSCWAMGGETLLKHFERLLGITIGATTADSMFTLLPCCCLGNCGKAPAVMVAERMFGPVTPEQVDTILADLRGTPS